MKRVLYLGVTCEKKEYLHYPVIALEPRSIDPLTLLQKLSKASHLLFTSKHAVLLFCALCRKYAMDILDKIVLSVGPYTTQYLKQEGLHVHAEAAYFCQEGVLHLVNKLFWPPNAHILHPRSSKARALLETRLSVSYEPLNLYDVVFKRQEPLPDLQNIDEILFTSPSTVEGFLQIFSEIPAHVQITCQGKITKDALLLKMPVSFYDKETLIKEIYDDISTTRPSL